MELFNNKRVMANMNKAIKVMGVASEMAGVEWKQGDRFGIKDLLAMWVKYPEVFPEQLQAQMQEFYDLFYAEVLKRNS